MLVPTSSVLDCRVDCQSAKSHFANWILRCCKSVNCFQSVFQAKSFVRVPTRDSGGPFCEHSGHNDCSGGIV